uniref:Activator of SKN7 protein 10 n=1 Tax=Lygus hesperus TaxID=30085 RepID=A0A0A9WVF9_LYGHE
MDVKNDEDAGCVIAMCLAANGETFCINTVNGRVVQTTVLSDCASFVVACDHAESEEGEHEDMYACFNKSNKDHKLPNPLLTSSFTSDFSMSISPYSEQQTPYTTQSLAIGSAPNDVVNNNNITSKIQTSTTTAVSSSTMTTTTTTVSNNRPYQKHHHHHHQFRNLLRHFHHRSLSCLCVNITELCMYAVDEVIQAA